MEIEVLTKQLEEARQREAAAFEEVAKLRVSAALRDVAEEVGFIDGKHGAVLAKDLVEWNPDLRAVIGKDGRCIREVLESVAATNPELLTTGANYQAYLKAHPEQTRPQRIAQIDPETAERRQLEALFGPHSDARKAGQLAKEDITRYREYRARAIKLGIL